MSGQRRQNLAKRTMRKLREKVISRRIALGYRHQILYWHPKPNITNSRQPKLQDGHSARAINYLEAYNLGIGLLVNFGERSLNFEQAINKKYSII